MMTFLTILLFAFINTIIVVVGVLSILVGIIFIGLGLDSKNWKKVVIGLSLTIIAISFLVAFSEYDRVKKLENTADKSVQVEAVK